jgi:hypothetical protein
MSLDAVVHERWDVSPDGRPGADSVDEALPLGGHHALPAPRAHARTNDDALRLDLDIALYRKGSWSAEVISCDPSGFSYVTSVGW